MVGAAVRESMTFAGRADQVREARAFVFRLLGPSHPSGDVAVLLASEVVTDCVLHGGSAGPGEAVTVIVGSRGSQKHLVVSDECRPSPGYPD